MSEIIKLSPKEFSLNFENYQKMDDSKYDYEFKEMGVYQPNLLNHFGLVHKSNELNIEEKEKIMGILLSVWVISKKFKNIKSQIVNMIAFDLEYNKTVSYFNNRVKLKKTTELKLFLNQAFENNRQKELHNIILKLLLTDYYSKNILSAKQIKWFCFVKACIDVIDKILNNDYLETGLISIN